jgi:hypothetical protein
MVTVGFSAEDNMPLAANIRAWRMEEFKSKSTFWHLNESVVRNPTQ